MKDFKEFEELLKSRAAEIESDAWRPLADLRADASDVEFRSALAESLGNLVTGQLRLYHEWSDR